MLKAKVMGWALCWAAGSCLSLSAWAGASHLVSLVSVADNTLVQDATGSLSNGAGLGMNAGLNGMNSVRRGLVRFDIASVVPRGATVQSASLRLVNNSNGVGVFVCELRRMHASWGEAGSIGPGGGGNGAPAQTGDATWLHRFWPDVPWNQAGGDFSTFASASAEVDLNGEVIFGSGQFVADVQSFVDAPEQNFGWLIKGDETQLRSVKRFATREEPDVTARPTLTIQYVTCGADLNGDAMVDDSDFSIFVIAYGLMDCADGEMAEGCPADLNGDGFVDDGDFSLFVVGYDAFLCE